MKVHRTPGMGVTTVGIAILIPRVLGFVAPFPLLPMTHGMVKSTGRMGAPKLEGTEVRVSSRNARGLVMQAQVAELTPRREQFFRMVSQGLEVGFENEDVSRVEDFVRYCRGELQPEVLETLHQPCEEYVKGMRAKPWWNAEEFPWVKKLEAESHIILDEFNAFMDNPLSSFARDSAYSEIMGAGWSGVRLQRLGKWIPENCSKFPKSVQLLRNLDIPIAVRGVMFARQVPGTGVSPHSDGRNFILTAHLGVRIPKDCWMRVGEEKRTWEEGKCLILDTSFEHETGNMSNQDRIVMIIDYWHPDLTRAEQDALAFVYDLRNCFESGEIPLDKTSEEEGGGVFGALKKAFGVN
ncbi:unnamed protein product [Choristocarpus tenellus]